MYPGDFQYRSLPRNRSQQSGYMLMVVIFLMLGLLIAALATAPRIAQQIKRDREEEMIHRGVQYARAVKKYYKKFGRYPATLEALEDTNHLRFLRKRYKDPLTPDGKWQLVRFGQVPFNATGRQGGTGGTGLTGGMGLPNVPGVTGLLTGQPTTATGTSPTTSAGTTDSSGTGTTGQTSSGFGQSGMSGSSGFGQSGTSGSSTFGQSTTGGGNQPFGGGAIIGVSSVSEKESLRIVNDKNHYKDWMFVYDPTFDRGGLITGPYDPKKQMGQFANTSQPGQQLGQPIGQQSGTGLNSNPSGSSFGQSNQSPMQPYQPPDQVAPQQNPH
jgi:type II secretory pathway pseudopilin PulG